MKLLSIGAVLVAFALFQVFLPVKSQRQIESRRVRPYEEKCDRGSGRCNFKDEGAIEEKDQDFKKDSGKERPPELTRDGFPSPGGEQLGIGSDYKTKPVGDQPGYDPMPVRGEVRYLPKTTHEPLANSHKPGSIPPDDDYAIKPTVDKDDRYRHSGGVHNTKPPVFRDELRPVRGSGGGRGYNPKPIREGVDRGGYNTKPAVNRDEYNPKVVSGEVGRGEYNPKRIVNRDYYNRGVDRYFSGPVDDDDYSPGPVGDDSGRYDEYEDDRDDYLPERKYQPVVERHCKLCVPYYQCQDGHIVTDGAGFIDPRRFKRQSEDFEDGKFKPKSCGSHHVCCSPPETSTVRPFHHSCGVRNSIDINSRIIRPSNEGEANFGEWPWQAAVLKAEGKVNIFQCGGVLIDKYHVLTVAHCVFHLYKYNEYSLKVRLGEWDTQTTSEFLAHQDYMVSKIMVHPEFKNNSLWNDIALLKLEEQVVFAPHIASICLPQHDEIFAGQNCVVTGWGKNAYMGGTFSNVMKEVALQVIDDYKCEEMLRKTRLGQFFQLHEGFLCAGGDYGLDSCKGDGGGPLMCFRKDKTYALAGLVSWGIDCGQPGVPGVYTKVQKYLNWISKNTGVSLQEYSKV